MVGWLVYVLDTIYSQDLKLCHCRCFIYLFSISKLKRFVHSLADFVQLYSLVVLKCNQQANIGTLLVGKHIFRYQ